MPLPRLLCLLLSIVLAGCTPAPPTPHWAMYQIGPYKFEIERVGAFSTTVEFDFKEEGGKRTGFVQITADALKLRVDDGKMTVNDKEMGSVVPGDEIRLPLDGKVTVNGKPVQ